MHQYLQIKNLRRVKKVVTLKKVKRSPRMVMGTAMMNTTTSMVRRGTRKTRTKRRAERKSEEMTTTTDGVYGINVLMPSGASFVT